MSKNKSSFWQIVRGICILAVVMIHCPNAVNYPVNSGEFLAWIGLRQLINFPVSIFIFLAAYFTNINNIDFKQYIYRRGIRLLIPYLLWSGFYTVVSVTKDICTGEEILWIRIFYNLLVGKASTPLYYIIVLLQLNLLAPVLINIIKNRGILSRLLWFLTPSYFIYIYAFNIIAGDTPPLYETLFPAWFVFFYLGLYIQMNKNTRKFLENFAKIRYIAVGLLLSVVEAYLLMKYGNIGFASSQIKISSFIYTFTIICLLLYRKDNERSINLKGRILKSFGDNSYGIFYIHCFILIFIRKVLILLDADNIWILYFTLSWILVSLISWVIVFLSADILEKLTKNDLLVKLIGLR